MKRKERKGKWKRFRIWRNWIRQKTTRERINKDNAKEKIEMNLGANLKHEERNWVFKLLRLMAKNLILQNEIISSKMQNS